MRDDYPSELGRVGEWQWLGEGHSRARTWRGGPGSYVASRLAVLVLAGVIDDASIARDRGWRRTTGRYALQAEAVSLKALNMMVVDRVSGQVESMATFRHVLCH
jgi:hypothetical protein